MTRPDWIETLRAEVRPVDPDPVLLAQLTQLSSGSTTPAARPGRSAGARLAIVLGGAIAVGATSWAAGALPGTESPFSPEERVTQQPTDPTPGDEGAPSSETPTSPAGSRTPTAPAGGESSTTSPEAPTTGPSSGRPSGAPSSAPPTGDPPGGVELPLPPLPTIPGVPAVPSPPGLDRVPDLPTPSVGLPGLDSDSGTTRRSPRPQEALVDQAR